LEGFDYCIRHILEDRSAPFRQCSYIHPQSGKRCPNAARRTDRRDSTLCPWHIKKLYLKRKQAHIQQMRINAEENHKKDELKLLIKDLEHYCPNSSHDNTRTNVDWVQLEDNSITASDHLRKKIAESANNLNSSYSDDECAYALVDDVLRSDAMESDSESVDSNNEDPLKHAGVYTAEEVSLVLRDKMLRLQSLYIDQFKHFQYLLREKKKKYLMSLKMEKEINGIQSIAQTVAQNKSSAQEKEDYEKLKALWRYHRSHGTEALLKKQANEKRKASIEGINYIPPSFPICIFAKGDEVCANKSLPLSNYCQKRESYLF
jgi:KAT8 regulatory NSL complex subunit 2